MHLSVDSRLPVADVAEALKAALAAEGLAIESSRPTPGGGCVTEVSDPLPEMAAEPSGRGSSNRTTYKVALYPRGGGGARLSTVRPTQLVDLMDDPRLAAPARALEARLERALLKAAGRGEEAGRG